MLIQVADHASFPYVHLNYRIPSLTPRLSTCAMYESRMVPSLIVPKFRSSHKVVRVLIFSRYSSSFWSTLAS